MNTNQKIKFSIGLLDNGFVPSRWQAINQSNVDKVPWRCMVLLSLRKQVIYGKL